MPHTPLDLQGHYAILRLTPGAGLKEVEQAYRAMEEEWRQHQDVPRFQIQEAYRVLSDPESKAAYDAQTEPLADQASSARPMILGGILVLLFFIGGFVFPGFLVGGPDSFNAGDVLLNTSGEAVFGKVLRLKSSHHFPNATISDAYLVELPNGEQRWYPASDLELHHLKTEEPARSVRVGDVPAAD